MLTVLTALTLSAAVIMAIMAATVWRRRGTVAGLALAVLLLAVAWWGLAYAGELSAGTLGHRQLWGDLKYFGICLLPPSWLIFVLDYTGRRRLLSLRLVLWLAIAPVVVWVLLAVPATHDLVRYYPEPTKAGDAPVVASGPVFWVNLAYSNALLLAATGLFVAAMARLARAYRLRATLLLVAALAPWAANLLYNFQVGPFERLDLTPFAFIFAGGILVYGLFAPRMSSLSTVAWNRVVETMGDGVLLLDALGRIVDANAAATGHLDRSRTALLGLRLEDVLPAADGTRHLEIERQQLADSAGAPEGELVMVRDITERKEHQRQLEELLAERTRIASTLASSLLPAQLPDVPGVALASRYLPARGGEQVGGDFFDVFPLDADRWGLVLGDVSGKGAEAAAVTGLIRYTLRAFATADAAPSEVLSRLNDALLRATDEERYCTLVYGVAETTGVGLRVQLCLAGHHQPLVRRVAGGVETVGALGTALGLLADPVLRDSAVLLDRGDVLCLFTDGLVEARAGNSWFGSERAAELLARNPHDDPVATVDDLVAAVEAFQQGPLADDLALLALQFHGEPACRPEADSLVPEQSLESAGAAGGLAR